MQHPSDWGRTSGTRRRNTHHEVTTSSHRQSGSHSSLLRDHHPGTIPVAAHRPVPIGNPRLQPVCSLCQQRKTTAVLYPELVYTWRRRRRRYVRTPPPPVARTGDTSERGTGVGHRHLFWLNYIDKRRPTSVCFGTMHFLFVARFSSGFHCNHVVSKHSPSYTVTERMTCMFLDPGGTLMQLPSSAAAAAAADMTHWRRRELEILFAVRVSAKRIYVRRQTAPCRLQSELIPLSRRVTRKKRQECSIYNIYSWTVVRVLTRLLQAYGGGGGGGASRFQNPHFNPITGAWLAMKSIYLKK